MIFIAANENSKCRLTAGFYEKVDIFAKSLTVILSRQMMFEILLAKRHVATWATVHTYNESTLWTRGLDKRAALSADGLSQIR